MYDEITCEYPLPQTGYRVLIGHSFQTKDLENLLDKYTISAGGKLIWHKESLESVPEEKRPFYGTPQWDGPFGRLIGSLRSVPEGEEELPYHGDIRFYDTFRVRGEAGERAWLEYKARFTEGTLSRIEVEDIHGLPARKRVGLGVMKIPASESGLGVDVVYLGEEAEIERDG